MDIKRPILTDVDIASLLARPKLLPGDWRRKLGAKPRPVDGQIRNELAIKDNKEKFFIKSRQNVNNPFDFSIIFVFTGKEGHEYIILRCNGRHPSEHTNRWEKLNGLPNHTFQPCFHVHYATQRYQEEGLKIDGYAEPTGSYSDFYTALDHFIVICGFDEPGEKDTNLSLFGRTT